MGFADWIAKIIGTVNGSVWGPVMLLLIVGTGLFLTIRLKGIQFSQLGYALKLALFLKNSECWREQTCGRRYFTFSGINDCFSSNDWHRKYRRGFHGNYYGGPRCCFLDVDHSISWNGYQI